MTGSTELHSILRLLFYLCTILDFKGNLTKKCQIKSVGALDFLRNQQCLEGKIKLISYARTILQFRKREKLTNEHTPVSDNPSHHRTRHLRQRLGKTSIP